MEKVNETPHLVEIAELGDNRRTDYWRDSFSTCRSEIFEAHRLGYPEGSESGGFDEQSDRHGSETCW